MKVLSLLQPWASLVVHGHKQIETRSWNTKYRGDLLIHASAGKKAAKELCASPGIDPFNQFIRHWTDLPFGAIIGKVTLLDTLATGYLTNKQFSLTSRNIVFMDKGISDKEKSFGDYSPNRFGWLLSNAVLFDKPIPARGSLGLWEFPDFDLHNHPQKQLF